MAGKGVGRRSRDACSASCRRQRLCALQLPADSHATHVDSHYPVRAYACAYTAAAVATMPLDLFAAFKRTRPSPPPKDDSTRPAHTMPSKLSKHSGAHATTSTTTQMAMSSGTYDVTDAFGRLSLGSGRTDRPDARPANGGEFVGGFAPHAAYPPDAMQVDDAPLNGTVVFPLPQRHRARYQAPGPLPTPPKVSMPIPQTPSRTMQFALGTQAPLGSPPADGSTRPPPVGRPHSDSGTFSSSAHLQTPQRPRPQQAPNSAPSKSGAATGAALAPLQTPSKRPRAASSPPSPSTSSTPSKGGMKVQCGATTKQDKRCTRMVPVTLPLSLITGDVEPHYCHQHQKSAFVEVQFRSHKDTDVKVEYARESARFVCRHRRSDLDPFAIRLDPGVLANCDKGAASAGDENQAVPSGRQWLHLRVRDRG